MQNMTDADRIKQYWNDRASGDGSPQATTLDYYLREIEFQSLHGKISQYMPSRVFDIGCGDAYTTLRLAAAFPNIQFVGGDYASSMIDNARSNAQNFDLKNIELINYDISHPFDRGNFDFVYTTRCLINLPGWEPQKAALTHISSLMTRGSVYVMIENFLDGHRDMNNLRLSFGLGEIKIRHHNCFFDAELLLTFLKTWFDVEDFQNISSTYYLVTRVIYSRICQDNGVEPDYFDPHHKLAARLPFVGNFGPVKMLTLKKRH
jgi:SAM-dependent methyltransferase